MNTAAAMISAHPVDPSIPDVLAECIQACTDAALACTSCADSCLAEDAVAELRSTIRLAQDAADMCTTTARFLSRLTETDGNLLRTILMLCRDFVATFAMEAAHHADQYEHCSLAIQACRDCEEACQRLLPRPF
ncbi:four-helix bundle copper-binding protein [Nesterenkonia sp. Act20]|uniref:four-helix bundle copper-binding protein n=1 Tax=Nesterenkonia sp. Act20 TaxID=1483432 RepID=UPI001C479C86|nr:four-helix bundle copper-binding protein [Nesterenkonia sp. Act20]